MSFSGTKRSKYFLFILKNVVLEKGTIDIRLSPFMADKWRRRIDELNGVSFGSVAPPNACERIRGCVG